MATPPDFSVGQVLTAAQMNAVGSWLVKNESFAAADPLNLTSIFTNDFETYKIYLNYYGSNAGGVRMNFFSGTNTLFNSNDYYRYGFDYTASNTFLGLYQQATYAELGFHTTALSQRTLVEITIANTQEASRKYIYSQCFNAQNGYMNMLQFQVVTTTVFTGVRFDAATGSITGNVQVYGLRAS